MYESVTRRDALSIGSVATVIAVSGCTSAIENFTEDEPNDEADREDDEGGDGNWTMYQGDLTNTGYTGNRGPTDAVTEQWQFDTDGGVETTPAVAGETVYVGDNTGFVYAIDATDGSERWSYDGRDRHDVMMVGTPTVRDGTVYFGGEQDFGSTGFVYAIDAEDGDERWVNESWEVHGSVAVADEMIYVATNYDGLIALEETESYDESVLDDFDDVDDMDDIDTVDDPDVVREINEALSETSETELSTSWTFAPEPDRGSPAFSGHPAVADGIVLASGTGGVLYALDAATGTEEWSVDSEDVSGNGPTVVDGTVYVGTGKLHALDLETGDEQWVVTDSSSSTHPAVADGTVYLGQTFVGGSVDRFLSALDASDGDTLWEYPTGNTVNSAPVVTDDAVYATHGSYADETGVVVAVDRETGDELWSYEVGHHVVAAPTVSEGVVYVTTTDGTVHALEEA